MQTKIIQCWDVSFMSKIGRDGDELSNARIDKAFDDFAINSRLEAQRAVNKAAEMYAVRLSQNAPRNEDKTVSESTGRNKSPEHSADNIIAKKAKTEGLRPSAQVGFKVSKGLGWYMHFPDGGTTVRGTIHQKAQNFIERTYREMEGPVLLVFKDALRKASR